MLGPRASLAHACCDTLGVVCPPEVRGSRSAGAPSSSNIPQTCDLEYFVCAQPNCDVTEDRTHGLPCSQGRFETHCGRLNRTGTVCEEPKKSTLRGTTFPGPLRPAALRRTMNEVKECLRSIEQKYKLFQQQQFTFIAALEHCRENAHDKIRPIASIEQVQSYMEHYCNNSTDRRILLMFLDTCAELSKLCQRFEALHSGTPVTNNLLEKCKALVSQSNDLSSLRAKYPHDVVNHLSCDEARNHYGGVVSLIPIILDLMKEWVAHSEKLPRKALQHVSEPGERQEATTAAAGPPQAAGAPPGSRKPRRRRLRKDSLKPKGKDEGSSKPPWRPPGGKL